MRIVVSCVANAAGRLRTPTSRDRWPLDMRPSALPGAGTGNSARLGMTWRCFVALRVAGLVLGLAVSLVSPASAQNPGAMHWRQKTGLGIMLSGVVAIGVAHERHAPDDPLRRLRPVGAGLVVAGAVMALLPVPEPVRPDVALRPDGWTVGKTWSWGGSGGVAGSGRPVAPAIDVPRGSQSCGAVSSREVLGGGAVGSCGPSSRFGNRAAMLKRRPVRIPVNGAWCWNGITGRRSGRTTRGSGRGGPGPHGPRPDRGRVRAVGPVLPPAPPDGRLDGVPGRDPRSSSLGAPRGRR